MAVSNVSSVAHLLLADAVPIKAADAPDTHSGCSEHPTHAAERAACAVDFRHFLHHWRFINRETGLTQRFDDLWQGQQNAVEQMRLYRWLYLLKAGKLGFTELECAYDGWVALFRQPNARVHLFSMNHPSAKALLKVVRFGLTHLPSWLGMPILSDARGGDTATQLTLYAGPDDERQVISYAAVKNAAIDQTATHTHVDEMARMPWPEDTWSSVESTVSPGGSVHIVTRGAGDGNFTAKLYWKAKAGETPLHPHFEPFNARPRIPEGAVPAGVDPTDVWYAQRKASMPGHQLLWLAPMTEDDALRGSAEGAFLDESIWLGCYDPDLPVLQPGDRTPLVLGVDAGVTNDYFAAVAVSRHPLRPLDPAVRAVKVWKPEGGREIDYDGVERWIRMLCLGGCIEGHPNSVGRLSAEPGCEACASNQRIPKHNVVQIAYDSYQLVDMMQRLRRDRVTWCNSFGQGAPRAEADANLRLLAVQRRIAHRNEEELNQAVRNANARVATGEDTKMRIVKRNPGSKIDTLVACSMAAAECLRLVMENAA